jgi:hypothetical protein
MELPSPWTIGAEESRRPRQRLHISMTSEATCVYDLTRGVYQVKQRRPQFENIGAAEMRLVRSVGRSGGRDFNHARPVELERFALHFIDQLAVAGHRVPLFEAWLKDPDNHAAAALRQRQRQLLSARRISVSPLRRAIGDPLLVRDWDTLHIVRSNLHQAHVHGACGRFTKPLGVIEIISAREPDDRAAPAGKAEAVALHHVWPGARNAL